MSEKYICPDCNQKEVEEVNACGASNYFCNSCKKLISRARVIQRNKDNK